DLQAVPGLTARPNALYDAGRGQSHHDDEGTRLPSPGRSAGRRHDRGRDRAPVLSRQAPSSTGRTGHGQEIHTGGGEGADGAVARVIWTDPARADLEAAADTTVE